MENRQKPREKGRDPEILQDLREDLHVTPGPPHWHQAVVAAVAAVVCYWLTHILHLKEGFWAVIISIAVVQTEVGATIGACRDQLVGAALGACFGWIAALIWHNQILIFGVILAVALVVSNLVGFKNAGRLAGVTMVITALIKLPEPPWRMAVDRFVLVALGILVALAISLLLYPRGWRGPRSRQVEGS